MLRRTIAYAAYMFGAGALTSLLSFGVDAAGMITRPKEAYGDYHIYLLVMGVGQALCINGINSSIQKFGADDMAGRRKVLALALRGFVILLMIAAPVGVAVGLLYKWSIAFAFFGVPFVVIFWWGRYIVRSSLDPKHEARLLIVGSLSKTVCIGTLLAVTDLRDAMVVGDVMAVVLGGMFTLWLMPRVFGASLLTLAREPVSREYVGDLYRFTRPLWVGGQIFAASNEVTGAFTAARLGSAAMGGVGAMRQVWQFAFKPMDFLGQAALPGLVAEHEGRSALYRDLLRMFLVLFPIIGVFVAAGSPLLLELMGIEKKYAEIPMMLMLLAAATPSTAMQIALHQYSIAEGHPRYSLYSHAASAVAIGLTIYPATSWFGVEGVVLAAWVGSTASGVALLWSMAGSYRADVAVSTVWWLQASAATLLALAPVYLTRFEARSWLIALPAALIYVASSFVLRLWKTEDARRMLHAVRRRLAERRRRDARESDPES